MRRAEIGVHAFTHSDLKTHFSLCGNSTPRVATHVTLRYPFTTTSCTVGLLSRQLVRVQAVTQQAAVESKNLGRLALLGTSRI